MLYLQTNKQTNQVENENNEIVNKSFENNDIEVENKNNERNENVTISCENSEIQVEKEVTKGSENKSQSKRGRPLGSSKKRYKKTNILTKRCGECEGCLQQNCGQCVQCLDKPCFGGPGIKKQACSKLVCLKTSLGLVNTYDVYTKCVQ